MPQIPENEFVLITDDQRFKKGLILFNTAEWYKAHDLFEELWHESNYPERTTLQGILQVAVAQLHLESSNKNGAIILYGEGLNFISIILFPLFNSKPLSI